MLEYYSHEKYLQAIHDEVRGNLVEDLAHKKTIIPFLISFVKLLEIKGAQSCGPEAPSPDYTGITVVITEIKEMLKEALGE